MRAQEFVTEAFDQPYKGKWEKSEYGDVDLNTKLPDGTNLSIMFNNQQDDDGQEVVQVEFYRNNSQEVTGEGDAQRIFATVLNAIQKYIKKYKPQKLSFSASKEPETDMARPGTNINPVSRAKLYDRLVQRYARAWGYQAQHDDEGDVVIYELSRLKQGVAEGLDDNGISFQVQKGKNKFATTLSVGGDPVGVYQYDANTGRSIAEIYPEFKGKGLGKLLVLHAIYTAANLGLDFQEDESRTSDYDNVLDSLSSNGYIVDDDGYWYVTGDGEQYLKQSLKQDVAEARGLAPTKPYDDLMANMGYFMSLNTVKIQQDAVDSNAQQELANMQQQFRQPILNGMSFFDVNRDTKISKNPKVAPILLKYVYDMLGYIEPRIKKYVKPDQQGKYLDRLNQIKNDYRGAVQQVS
jgi:hypothetical protein